LAIVKKFVFTIKLGPAKDEGSLRQDGGKENYKNANGLKAKSWVAKSYETKLPPMSRNSEEREPGMSLARSV
jgi:hypothetical protein